MSEQTASGDGAKEREAWHAEQEAKIQIFRYTNQFTKPEDFGRGKAMVKLGRSDILRGSVQVVGKAARPTSITTPRSTACGWC